MRDVPRFLPDFSRYSAPETLQMAPRFLTKGFLDAVWWLAAYPVIEFSEVLQEHHIIQSVFFLP
jgi:hypothetical protein